MSDEELIARLRDDSGNWLTDAAADRIEALVKERDDAVIKRAAWELEAKTQQARAERLEEALLWCSGSADFNEGGVAREGWLKVCDPLLKGESHD